jgi:hypothetical protein
MLPLSWREKSICGVPIDALTGKVGSRTQMSGNQECETLVVGLSLRELDCPEYFQR